MDPLSVLRDHTIRNDLDSITLMDGQLQFSSLFSFPASTPTSFRSKNNSLYSLHSLLFFLRHHHLKHSDYLQAARLHRLPVVTLPDRKPLLDYLLGVSPSLPSVPPLTLTPPSPLPQPPSSPPPLPREYPLKTRLSLLESPGRDFYSLLVSSAAKEERLRPQQGKARGLDEGKLRVKKGGEGVPIILVPSAAQTLITIYNVKEFLEDGVYVGGEGGRGGRPECVTVQKRLSRDREVAAYEVRDKPGGLRPEDWERVVAVFVLGKEWQFKDWPFKDHVQIFNKSECFFSLWIEGRV